MRATTASEERLVALAAAETRGPRRDGAYALWLVVRAAEALLPPDPVARKTHRRRLQASATRLGDPRSRAAEARARRRVPPLDRARPRRPSC
jgi:hypothetical protein